MFLNGKHLLKIYLTFEQVNIWSVSLYYYGIINAEPRYVRNAKNVVYPRIPEIFFIPLNPVNSLNI